MKSTAELRDALQELLLRWEQGLVRPEEVHEEAESLVAECGLPAKSRSDPASLVVEVLAHLEIMNQQLVVAEDVPFILDFLSTASGKERDAWQAWEAYWNGIDYEQRKQALASNPFYLTSAAY